MTPAQLQALEMQRMDETALAAMNAFIAKRTPDQTYTDLAVMSYRMAEEMLKVREFYINRQTP